LGHLRIKSFQTWNPIRWQNTALFLESIVKILIGILFGVFNSFSGFRKRILLSTANHPFSQETLKKWSHTTVYFFASIILPDTEQSYFPAPTYSIEQLVNISTVPQFRAHHHDGIEF
jgi:hypothetical protein